MKEFYSRGKYKTIYRVITTEIQDGQLVDVIESSDSRGTTEFTAKTGYLEDLSQLENYYCNSNK